MYNMMLYCNLPTMMFSEITNCIYIYIYITEPDLTIFITEK